MINKKIAKGVSNIFNLPALDKTIPRKANDFGHIHLELY